MKPKLLIALPVAIIALLAGVWFLRPDQEPIQINGNSTGTPVVIQTVLEQPQKFEALRPDTEKDETFVKRQYNLKGLLSSEILYGSQGQFEDTSLAEAEVLTLYVRAKNMTASEDLLTTLFIGRDEISIRVSPDTLKKGWTTSWESLKGKWTKKELNEAYYETYGAVSEIRLYAEDQHSLTENFDSYSDGDLNGQGSWSGTAIFDIQGTTVQAGVKAVRGTGASGAERVTKTFTAEAIGGQVFYMQTASPTDGCGTYTEVKSGSTYVAWVGMENAARTMTLYYRSGGGTASATLLSGYSAGTWYKIEIGWNATTNEVRARVNDGAWSGYYTADDFGSADTINLAEANATQVGYWDSFSTPAAPTPTPSVPDDDLLILNNF